MGFELSSGTLYMMEPSGKQFELGNISSGLVEIDTLSTDETPNISYNFIKDMSASFEAPLEISPRDLSTIYSPMWDLPKVFDIEHNVPIMIQARWHKKKRINKKWLKRYGMKLDTVKMRAKAHTLSYNTETGECEFETNKIEYVWRPDQLRKNLKIEI